MESFCICSLWCPGSGVICGTLGSVLGGFLWQGSAGGFGGELQPADRAVLQLRGSVHLSGWVQDMEQETSTTTWPLERLQFSGEDRDKNTAHLYNRTITTATLHITSLLQCCFSFDPMIHFFLTIFPLWFVPSVFLLPNHYSFVLVHGSLLKCSWAMFYTPQVSFEVMLCCPSSTGVSPALFSSVSVKVAHTEDGNMKLTWVSFAH